MTSGLCVMGNHGNGAGGEPLQREAEIGHLCLYHRGRLTRLLVDVRDLWTDLAFIDQAGSAPKDDSPRTKHTKAPSAPAPANLDVLALRDPRTRTQRIPEIRDYSDGDQSEPVPPVIEIIGGWVRVVAEERPIAPEHLPYSTIAQLQLLQRHGDWIAAADWVDDLFIELGDVRKALSAALRDQPYRRIGQCPLPAEHSASGLCGGALMQENGADAIRCAECGAGWASPQERARLAISLESA